MNNITEELEKRVTSLIDTLSSLSTQHAELNRRCNKLQDALEYYAMQNPVALLLDGGKVARDMLGLSKADLIVRKTARDTNSVIQVRK